MNIKICAKIFKFCVSYRCFDKFQMVQNVKVCIICYDLCTVTTLKLSFKGCIKIDVK